MINKKENKKITQESISKWAKYIQSIKTKNKRYEFMMNLNESRQVETYRL